MWIINILVLNNCIYILILFKIIYGIKNNIVCINVRVEKCLTYHHYPKHSNLTAQAHRINTTTSLFQQLHKSRVLN